MSIFSSIMSKILVAARPLRPTPMHPPLRPPPRRLLCNRAHPRSMPVWPVLLHNRVSMWRGSSQVWHLRAHSSLTGEHRLSI